MLPTAASHPSHREPRTLPRYPLDDLARRLGAVVERSPADETEVMWLETLSGAAVSPPDDVAREPRRRQTVQVRVREGGRIGFHRHGTCSPRELDGAVRLALGQARLSQPGPPLPLAGPGGHRTPEKTVTLHDPAVAGLDAATAGDLLASGRKDGERLALEWHELRLVVANSRGLAHGAEATSLTLTARCGDGPGAGRARGSARSLAALAAPLVVERARRRRADGGGAIGDPPAGAVPVVLAPEAAAVLVQAFSDAALSSHTFASGLSCLAGRLGEAVADPAFTLVDDGTDPAGLPFPMDCDGWPKRRVPLIEAGVLASPALDADLGRELGRTPTPHAVASDESRPGNLFVLPGGTETPADDPGEDDDALLVAAPAGLWISALEAVHLGDPQRGAFRTVARGVRRIEGGALGAPLPDLAWHTTFDAVFGRLAAVGTRSLSIATHGAWGACRCPALVLPAAAGLRPIG